MRSHYNEYILLPPNFNKTAKSFINIIHGLLMLIILKSTD